MNKLKSFFKNVKHTKTEKFAVTFIIIASCFFALLASMIFVVIQKSMYRDLSTTVYTQSFTFSKSGLSGNVIGVYSNEDKTRSFVMLKFADMTDMPLDASNYTMYLSAYHDHMNKEPKCTTYVYGTTGYVGFMLTDSNGIDNQVLDLTIRNNAELTTATATSNTGVQLDSSFKDFDQAQVYFNPGADGAETIKPLNDDVISPSYVYYYVLGYEDEESMRDELAETIDGLQVNLNRMDEYEKRLAASNVLIPERNEYIVGDKIEVSDLNVKYFKPDKIFSGGLDFNWQDFDAEDGNLDKILNGSNANAFFNKLNKLSAADTVVYEQAKVWYNKDGSVLDLNADSVNDKSDLRDSISELERAYSEYFTLKREYQTKLLVELLKFEYDMQVLEDGTNQSSDNLVLWQQK